MHHKSLMKAMIEMQNIFMPKLIFLLVSIALSELSMVTNIKHHFLAARNYRSVDQFSCMDPRFCMFMPVTACNLLYVAAMPSSKQYNIYIAYFNRQLVLQDITLAP